MMLFKKFIYQDDNMVIHHKNKTIYILSSNGRSMEIRCQDDSHLWTNSTYTVTIKIKNIILLEYKVLEVSNNLFNLLKINNKKSLRDFIKVINDDYLILLNNNDVLHFTTELKQELSAQQPDRYYLKFNHINIHDKLSHTSILGSDGATLRGITENQCIIKGGKLYKKSANYKYNIEYAIKLLETYTKEFEFNYLETIENDHHLMLSTEHYKIHVFYSKENNSVSYYITGHDNHNRLAKEDVFKTANIQLNDHYAYSEIIEIFIDFLLRKDGNPDFYTELCNLDIELLYISDESLNLFKMSVI